MSTHNRFFRQVIRKLFTWYPFLSRPMVLHVVHMETVQHSVFCTLCTLYLNFVPYHWVTRGDMF